MLTRAGALTNRRSSLQGLSELHFETTVCNQCGQVSRSCRGIPRSECRRRISPGTRHAHLNCLLMENRTWAMPRPRMALKSSAKTAVRTTSVRTTRRSSFSSRLAAERGGLGCPGDVLPGRGLPRHRHRPPKGPVLGLASLQARGMAAWAQNARADPGLCQT